jgi:hypothetical protein
MNASQGSPLVGFLDLIDPIVLVGWDFKIGR